MTTVAAPEPFTKITVKGRINLGFAHELLQEPRTDLRDHYYSRGAGWERELDGLAVGQDEALGQILEFKFSDHVTKPLHITDDGLVTSFGIFGAPGCGKTVLLMHMLEQVLAHNARDKNKRYGALILDPKAALQRDVLEMAKRAGRQDDLRIINTDFMNRNGQRQNVIGCTLDPYELGAILVLAGRSAGIDASDPFWFQEWTNLFTSSVSILRAQERLDNPNSKMQRPVTLRQLLDAICNEMPDPGPDGKRERVIQNIARTLAERLDRLSAEDRRDVQIDLQTLRRFFSQDYVATVEAFTTKAFGMFRRSRLECYSDDALLGDNPPFYEDIIESGKIVLVSVSPSEPALAKTLCTLIKCLFQRTVLARGELLAARTISNRERPLVIACDEYSEIASEVPGQSMGDGQFLALARQYGCMAILATQSVNVLQASSLRETWRSVFSNFAAKIYMRLVDNETAEEATKLAGESDWKVVSQGNSLSRDGNNVSTQRDLRERKNLPSSVLTHVVRRGQAVVIGSLDGGESTPGTYFMSVPKPKPADQQSPSTTAKREAVAHA